MGPVLPCLPEGRKDQEVPSHPLSLAFLEGQEDPAHQGILVAQRAQACPGAPEVRQVQVDPPSLILQVGQTPRVLRVYQVLLALLQVLTPRLGQVVRLLRELPIVPGVQARQAVLSHQMVREYRPSLEFQADLILRVNLLNPQVLLFLALPLVQGIQADQYLPWVQFYQYCLLSPLFL